jgi:hypothetical protein
VDDNGAGLRALFYGLCAFWEIDVWTEEQTGPMPADFYLMPSGMGTYVVIVPEPVDRQVEIAALTANCLSLIVLDREDLDHLRACAGRTDAMAVLRQWHRSGSTHAAVMRRHAGIA